MKKSIDRAYKIVDSSELIVIKLIEKYAILMYELGYDSVRYKRSYKQRLSSVEGVDTAVKQLEHELTIVIERLLEELNTISRLATDEYTDEESEGLWLFKPFLASVIFGSTFNKRIKSATDRLVKEIDEHLRYALDSNLSKRSAKKSFLKELTSPARKKSPSPFKSELVGRKAVSTLTYLFDDTLNRGFHEANIHYWTKAGIQMKYIVAVLDSKTCSVCTDLHLRIFNVDEQILPVHGSCRCEEYPLDDNYYRNHTVNNLEF